MLRTLGNFALTFDDSALDQVVAQLATLTHKVEGLMALDKSTQDKIDALAAQLQAAADGIRADIAALKDKVAAGATPEEINTALDALTTKADAFTALDAENS